MNKIMYYDNILIHDLMDGDYLEHHGVLGMKWGIRRYQPYSTVPRGSGKGGQETGLAKKRTRLEGKKASNNAKIKKYQNELKKPRSQKELAKIAKYERKVNKINASSITRRAKKHRMRYGQATPLGEIQMFRLAGAQNKLAKAHGKTDTYKVKIADLEYKNSRIDKKLGKISTKESINAINDKRRSSLAEFDKNFKNNPNISKADYKVTRKIINSEYDGDVKAIKQSPKRKKIESARKSALEEFDKNFKNNPNISKEDYEFTRKLINSEYDKKARRRR